MTWVIFAACQIQFYIIQKINLYQQQGGKLKEGAHMFIIKNNYRISLKFYNFFYLLSVRYLAHRFRKVDIHRLLDYVNINKVVTWYHWILSFYRSRVSFRHSSLITYIRLTRNIVDTHASICQECVVSLGVGTASPSTKDSLFSIAQ